MKKIVFALTIMLIVVGRNVTDLKADPIIDPIGWTQMNEDGFGDPNNIGTFPYPEGGLALDGNLYVGTVNEVTGGEIWRSSDGVTWNQVSANGFGDPNNIGTYPYKVFEDNLYVGTVNYVTGTEVWRSSDGVTWNQVNEDGFGNPDNFMCCANGVFEGNLYCGTLNVVTGGEIWATPGPTAVTPAGKLATTWARLKAE